MENSSSMSGHIAFENGCLGFRTENGTFYQLMLREAPRLNGSGPDARVALYSRAYQTGSKIYGEGQELTYSVAEKLVATGSRSTLCADKVFLLNKVYDGPGEGK